jgi:hypothetical protein
MCPAINVGPSFLFEVICMSLRPVAPSVIMVRVNEDCHAVPFVSYLVDEVLQTD